MSATVDGKNGITVEELANVGMEMVPDSQNAVLAVPGIGQLGLYLVVFMTVSWGLMYFIPTTFLFTVILPASFYVLYSLVVFCPLVSGGWPFAPTLGNWKGAGNYYFQDRFL